MDKKLLRSALFGAVAIPCYSISYASDLVEQTESMFSPIFTAGITVGGDTLAERQDGIKLKAGGLFYAGAGVNARITDTFDLQTIFGYHFDSLDASNGSADFDRFYLEILPAIRLGERAKLGIGVLNVMSAEYTDPFGSIKMENSTGLLLEWSYQLSRNLSWGIRYSDLDYTIKSVDGINISPFNLKVDGGYFGVSFSLTL